MLEKLLRKRTIIFILITLVIVPSLVARFLNLEFVWWVRSSIFFAITVVLGIFIGQLSTIYKIRHIVETRVDQLVNKLALPQITRLDDPNLELNSFFEFSKGLISLLCEDFAYQAGVVHIFDDSLTMTFRHSLVHGTKQSVGLIDEDYKLMREWCRYEKSGQITASLKSERIFIPRYTNRSELSRPRKVDAKSKLLNYSYIRLLPIHLDTFYLGYIGLFRYKKPLLVEKFLDTVQLLSEKSILQAIEDKKIDDAVKNFLFRQSLLQIFITLNHLDNIYERTQTFKSIKELGDQIVEALRDCWRFNGCLILTVDNQLSHSVDKNVNLELIKSKLIPRIKLSFSTNESNLLCIGSAADVFEDESPGFQEYIAIKIEKDEVLYGYLIATSKRAFSDFEKQMLIILENYKIDDAYTLFKNR